MTGKSGVWVRAIGWIVVVVSTSGSVRAQEICQPTFEAQRIFNVAPNFGMNALYDFNGDGFTDLTVGLDFYLGDGTGKFPTAVRVDSPWPVAFDMQIDDFDHDGIPDAAMSGFAVTEVMFYYGRREEGVDDFFEPFVPVDTSSYTQSLWHIAKADFNLDGWMDVVGVSIGDTNQVVLMNQRERNFAVSPLRSRQPGHMLTTGDFDGDGAPDVAMGGGSSVSLFLGNGDGTFGNEILGTLQYGGTPRSGHRFRSADIDGDGRSDLFATGDDRVLVYLGESFGTDPITFPREPSLTLPVDGSVRFMEILDVNADGILDVVTLAAAAQSRYRIFYGEGGEGIPTFVAGDSVDTGLGGHGSVLAVGDIDGDDALDLALTTEDTSEARVFLNDDSCEPVVSLVQRGDANGDGNRDLSDAVSILSALFLGGELVCRNASEVNDDGELNLTDAVYLLNYLFLGGEAPVGEDPTEC